MTIYICSMCRCPLRDLYQNVLILSISKAIYNLLYCKCNDDMCGRWYAKMVLLHVNRYFLTCCWFSNPKKTWFIFVHNFTYFEREYEPMLSGHRCFLSNFNFIANIFKELLKFTFCTPFLAWFWITFLILENC
jgi:hypothetical protein